MSVILPINGINYPYPQTGEENWGDNATNWAVAITNGTLQKAGGLFTLTSEVDFGGTFGLKSVYFKSRTGNPAVAGQVRLANADSINFRNLLNNGDLAFKPGSSDAIPQWNGIDLVNLSTAQTLSNKTLVSPIITGSATFVDITTTGNTIIGDANTDTLAINADIVTNLRPDVIATYDIGSSSNRWRDIFVSRDAYVGRSLHGDGTALLPGIAFESEPGLGIYRGAAGVLSTVTTGGIVVTQHLSDRFRALRPIVIEDGTVSVPSLSFENDQDTGIYRPGANSLNIATGGVAAISINNSQQSTFGGNTYHADGTVSLPGIAFSGDIDTGIYRLSSGTIGLASNGQSAAQISLTLARFLGQIGAIDGNSAAPGYAFSSDLSSGLSLSGSSLRVSVLGSIVWSAETTQISPRLPMRSFAAAGTSAAPNYSFNSDPDTGMYNVTADILGFSTNAVPRLLIKDAAVETQGSVSFRGPNGTSSLPTYAFTSEVDTGFYIPVATQIGISIGGNPKGAFRNDGFNYTNYYASTDGAANSAVYGFLSDTDTGLYRISSDNLGVTAGGVLKLSVNTTSVLSKVPVLSLNGTAAAPSYAWENETNSGLYRISGTDIGLSVGGALKWEWAAAENASYSLVRIKSGLGLVLNNGGNTQAITIDGNSAAASYTISLPAAAPASNTFLKYDGANYIWSPEAGVGDISNGGNSFGSAITIGTNDAFNLNFETNNVTRLTINQSNQLLTNDGTLTLPAYSFASQASTGMWLNGSGSLNFSVAGSNYLNLSGSRVAPTFQVQAIDGTAGVPSYSFANDTNTGFYRSSLGVMTAVAAGNTVFQYLSDRVRALRPLMLENGTGAAPSLAFENDQNTGIYRPSGGALAVTISGTHRVQFDASAITSNVRYVAPDGSAAAPAYSFSSELTTGLYWAAANTLATVVNTVVVTQHLNDRFRSLRPVVVEDGSIAVPSYSFESEQGLGLYRPSANQMSVVSNGSVVVKFSDTEILPNKRVNNITGSPSAPSITFQGDEDTGFYANIADGTIGFASNGASMAQFSATLARFLAPIGSIDGNSAAPGIAFSSDVSTGFSLSGTVLSASVSGGYTTRFESNKITLHNPTANSDYNIVRNFNTGSITIAGGTSDTNGGAIKLYGATSAGNPDEIVLRNSTGQTALFSNDHQMSLGNSSLATSRFTLVAAPSTGAGIFRMNSDDQNLTVTGGLSDTTGASVILYGNNASGTPAYTLFTNNNVSTGHIDTNGAWRIGANLSTQQHRLNGDLEHRSSAAISYVQEPLKTTGITNNTTDDIYTVPHATYKYLIVDFSIIRGALFESGTIHVATDGTTAQCSSIGVGDTGVDFTADISGANLRLRYIADNNGDNGNIKFAVRKW